MDLTLRMDYSIDEGGELNGASPGGGGDVNQLPVWCAGERLVMTSDVSLLETGALLNLNWIWRLIERETISLSQISHSQSLHLLSRILSENFFKQIFYLVFIQKVPFVLSFTT